MCKIVSAAARSSVYNPAAGAITRQRAEYQDCVVWKPPHTFLIHYQAHPVLLSYLCSFLLILPL